MGISVAEVVELGIFHGFKQWLVPGRDPQTEQGEDSTRKTPEAATAYGKLLSLTPAEKMRMVSQLTGREHQLCLLLLQGYTLKESAQKLGIKYSTANTHMTGLYKKLRIGTRAELIINYRDCADGIPD